MLITPSELNGELVAWSGKRSCNPESGCVFSMPGVSFAVSVRGCNSVQAFMSGGSGYFRVSAEDLPSGVFHAINDFCLESSVAQWVTLACDLNPETSYVISVMKKTEAHIRSLLSTFLPVKVHSIRIDRGSFLALKSKDIYYPMGWLEVIGDSDACGFGVDGQISSSCNFLSMDASMEDVSKGWGCLLAEYLGLGRKAANIVAGSGLGLTRNAPLCGDDTVPMLWKKIHQEEEPKLAERPIAVVMLVGGNDFYVNSNVDKSEFIFAMQQFVSDIRQARGKDVPIFIFQCHGCCTSSAGAPNLHPREDPAALEISHKLVEFSREAVEKLHADKKLYFSEIKVEMNLETDYAIMMHWSATGQQKIAQEMCGFVQRKLSI